jgi:hypothetical protein
MPKLRTEVGCYDSHYYLDDEPLTDETAREIVVTLVERYPDLAWTLVTSIVDLAGKTEYHATCEQCGDLPMTTILEF